MTICWINWVGGWLFAELEEWESPPRPELLSFSVWVHRPSVFRETRSTSRSHIRSKVPHLSCYTCLKTCNTAKVTACRRPRKKGFREWISAKRQTQVQFLSSQRTPSSNLKKPQYSHNLYQQGFVTTLECSTTTLEGLCHSWRVEQDGVWRCSLSSRP